MRWSGLVVLLVGFAALLGTQNLVRAQQPNVGSYETKKYAVIGDAGMVFDHMRLPRMLQVFYDRMIFDYEVRSDKRVHLIYASGKTVDVVQKFRSAEGCNRVCHLEVEMENDEVSEFNGRVRLLFTVFRSEGNAMVQVGFRIQNSYNDQEHLEWRMKTWAMLDNAMRFFRPAGCGGAPTYSGLCNNRFIVASGGSNQVLGRMENQFGMNRINNPAYEDGMRSPRQNKMPNARRISNLVTEVPSPRRRFFLTDAFVTFGQFLDHDIVLTPGGGRTGLFADNSMEIKVKDPSDEIFNDGKIMFSRSAYDRRDLGNDGYQEVVPRQHLNAQTSFVDASQVYGATPERGCLRAFEDGLMLTNTTSTGVHLPNNIPSELGLKQEMDPNPNDTRFLAAGDARANENALLLSFHTLFVREHNRVARILKRTTCARCNDEKIFQLARRVVMAEMQIITYEEWLPLLLGFRMDYYGYDSSIDAGILQEFSTAAMRFGHSMQSEEHWLVGAGRYGSFEEINLRDSFFNPDLVKEHGIEKFLRGAAEHIAQPFDHQISDSLRNFLFRKIPQAVGVDLFAANIQRGRDHGLPPYNQVRLMCDLDEINFDQIAEDIPGMSKVLKELYESPADIDLFVGGILEPRINGGELGETFSCIVEKQFHNLMHGDRFFYKGAHFPNEINNNDQLRPITRGYWSFRELVLENTNIKPHELPWNLFEA